MELKVEVKGKGKESFESLIRDAIMDLGISGSIESLFMYLDPSNMLFIMRVRAKPTSRIIRLTDVAEVSSQDSKVIVKVLDERYSPLILKLLESAYKGRVFQASRHEIVVQGPVDKEELGGLAVCDYAEVVRDSMLELVRRIMPEGFRSIKVLSRDKHELLIMTSEDPLTNELISRASNLLGEA